MPGINGLGDVDRLILVYFGGSRSICIVIHGKPADLKSWRCPRRLGDADLKNALFVFRECFFRRGAQGKDARLFLEALQHFSIHNITWRALSERSGKGNSVWKRFDRLRKSGVLEAFFDSLASLGPVSPPHPDVRFHSDASPCLSGWRRRGQEG